MGVLLQATKSSYIFAKLTFFKKGRKKKEEFSTPQSSQFTKGFFFGREQKLPLSFCNLYTFLKKEEKKLKEEKTTRIRYLCKRTHMHYIRVE